MYTVNWNTWQEGCRGDRREGRWRITQHNIQHLTCRVILTLMGFMSWSCYGRVMLLLLIFYWVLGSCWYFCYYTQLHDTTSILKFGWWSFLPRFLLLAIPITIAPCSLLLLHFCAMVYCILIYQVCQVTRHISFKVLIQVTLILLLLVTLLCWRMIHMQYITLLCAPTIVILFQVKSFNNGIILVDPVITTPCAMFTSGTRHMSSNNRGHLLFISHYTMLCKYIFHNLPLYYLEYKFFNWLHYCYILYYVILLLFYPDEYPSFLLFSLIITSLQREGWYPGLTLGTHIHDWAQ